MRWMVLLIAALALSGCGERSRSFEVSGDYGTLVYNGVVRRNVDGTNFTYNVSKLIVGFDPSARINATSRIVAPRLCFVTTAKPPKAGPWIRTFYNCKRLPFHLDAARATGEINGIQFVVPRVRVRSADNAGLAITDDASRLVWPLHADLR